MVDLDKHLGRPDLGTDAFVELKTSMVIRGPQDEARFEKCVFPIYVLSFFIQPRTKTQY